jgi:hypothetical protein
VQRPLADSCADASITLVKPWAFGRRPLMIEIAATSFMRDTECSPHRRVELTPAELRCLEVGSLIWRHSTTKSMAI